MARRFDQMLEPGERVVYRTDTFRTALRVFFASLAAIVVCWGLFLSLSDVETGMAARAITILLAVGFGVSFGVWFWSGAAIVTDRRLLYDRGPWASFWGRQRLVAIALVDISELTGMRPSWRQAPSLRLTDGQVIGLGGIRNPKRLAEALGMSTSDAPSHGPHAQGGEGNGA